MTRQNFVDILYVLLGILTQSAEILADRAEIQHKVPCADIAVIYHIYNDNVACKVA